MAIKIIKKKPDKSVAKKCVCKHCGATFSDKNLFSKANLRWFYENLQIRYRRHKLYLEAIDRIEVLINKA